MQVAAGLQSALYQQQESAQQVQGRLHQALHDKDQALHEKNQALLDKDQALKKTTEVESALRALLALLRQLPEDTEAQGKREAALRADLMKLKVWTGSLFPASSCGGSLTLCLPSQS